MLKRLSYCLSACVVDAYETVTNIDNANSILEENYRYYHVFRFTAFLALHQSLANYRT